MKKTSDTWNWIKKNGNFKISMETVFKIIKNWMVNPKEEKDESFSSPTDKIDNREIPINIMVE